MNYTTIITGKINTFQTASDLVGNNFLCDVVSIGERQADVHRAEDLLHRARIRWHLAFSERLHFFTDPKNIDTYQIF